MFSAKERNPSQLVLVDWWQRSRPYQRSRMPRIHLLTVLLLLVLALPRLPTSEPGAPIEHAQHIWVNQQPQAGMVALFRCRFVTNEPMNQLELQVLRIRAIRPGSMGSWRRARAAGFRRCARSMIA
ncbi:MAG: hypothetical protein HC837_00500 [Chloroflexaceae bacterium]|nr:hypothetical protein [Chloroflexaceae bacterium]